MFLRFYPSRHFCYELLQHHVCPRLLFPSENLVISISILTMSYLKAVYPEPSACDSLARYIHNLMQLMRLRNFTDLLHIIQTASGTSSRFGVWCINNKIKSLNVYLKRFNFGNNFQVYHHDSLEKIKCEL